MRQPLVLYPSLDDLCSLPDHHDHAIDDDDETELKNRKIFSFPQGSDDFIALARRGSLHPAVRAPTDCPAGHCGASARRRKGRLDSNFEALKKRKRENAAVTVDHVRLAIETADLAAMEIARMSRAIAELESMLQTGGPTSALSH
jgi:hypothetical protein